MKRLELEVYRYENLVFGQVVYQDEGLRNAGMLAEVDGFYITSAGGPELCRDGLFVCGVNKDCDHDVFYRRCENNDETLEIIMKIKACLDIINATGEEMKLPINKIERVI